MKQYHHHHHLLLLLLFSHLLIGETSSAIEFESHIIKKLPGYPGTLPFKLETGYIRVGENYDLQMFYYFVESERDPVSDPLIFWLTGGPGCSGLSGLLYGMGPLAFNLEAFDRRLPSFLLTNKYSWTKVANIIFIDSPVGTGFSYSTTQEGYYSNDNRSTKDNYTFLRKWLLKHPTFIKNWVYTGGDSYGGKIAPMVALEIDQGNEAGLEPRIILQGYILGNSPNNRDKDSNERIPYAHRMALISDEYFELAKSTCKGNYFNPDPNDDQCLYALQPIEPCIDMLNPLHILEPVCQHISPKCRSYNYIATSLWVNNQSVQGALHIRKGTISEWERCNKTLGYNQEVESIQHYHQLLSNKGYRVLAYSGDHDYIVPYLITLKWIHDLNLTLQDAWRPWIVDGQVAGYTEKHANNQAFITFATVKGAGHIAPEYKPKECLAMVDRWLSLGSI